MLDLTKPKLRQCPVNEIECWVFDLDDTLYPRDNGLWAQIDQRISAYVKRLLKVDDNEVARLRQHFRKNYGGALKGLQEEYQVDAQDYLFDVHDIDYSCVKPSPMLAQNISALPGKKLVFTNGDRPHAERTLAKLGIDNVFDDIFDIVAADYTPKPYRQTYDKFVAHYGIDPRKALMVEDSLANLETAKMLGMHTVLVGSSLPQNKDCPVDVRVDRVETFLDAVMDGLHGR